MEFNTIRPYTKDLESYLKRKIKGDQWKDVYQDSVCYLLTQPEKNIGKGYIINCANFFISKWRQKELKWSSDKVPDQRFEKMVCFYNTSSGFNGFEIDDTLLNKLQKIESEDWRLVQLQLEFGLSIAKISEMTGLSIGCIKTRLKRIKTKLC